MSRCCVDAPAQPPYDVLRSVADVRPPDTRLSVIWTSRPGAVLPPPPAPSGDPFGDDPHLGFRPVT